jgi:hypothetical protein
MSEQLKSNGRFFCPQYLVVPHYFEGYVEESQAAHLPDSFFPDYPELIEYCLKQSISVNIARCFVTGRHR